MKTTHKLSESASNTMAATQKLSIALSLLKDERSLFEKLYDAISYALYGKKSFNWGELKGL